MYLVVSRWDFLPDNWENFRAAGDKMREDLLGEEGIERMESIRSGEGSIVVMVGYRSEQDYRRLVDDPNSAFAKAAEKNGLEEYGHWVWSERGELLETD